MYVGMTRATDGVDFMVINRDLEVVEDIPSFKSSMLPFNFRRL
jgi:hypothetical protein